MRISNTSLSEPAVERRQHLLIAHDRQEREPHNIEAGWQIRPGAIERH
jgi:hypothetical protein